MTHGTVTSFDHKHGFGFLKVTGSSDQVFVHVTAIANPDVTNLRVGQHVTFDLVSDLEAPRAANVFSEMKQRQ